MKKMKIIAVLGAAALAVVITGAVVANFQSDPVKASQNLDMKTLSVAIDVEQDFEGKVVLPGEKLVEALNVKNTADTDVYVRVSVKGYLTTPEGEKYFGESTYATRGLSSDLTGSYKYKILDVDLGSAEENGWILGFSDEEETVLYYTKPVSAGDFTTNVFNSVTLSGELGNDFKGKGYGATVSVVTDAIQASSAEAAMMSEWGVMAIFDEDGNITEISE